MAAHNVFIVGLDEINRAMLAMLPQAKRCRFSPALDFAEIREVDHFDIEALLATAARRMEAVDGGPHGVGSFYDFPGTTLSAILAQRFSLPGPSLESVLKCEHKYWSRLEQQKVIPGNIPAFQAFDPFDDDAFDKLDLIPPFWIKPIKSFRSYLAFLIHDERQLREVLHASREQSEQLTGPFRRIMTNYGMPTELAEMRETFIAESPIGGAQCTLEGYVHDGQVVTYGVVDSVNEADSSSFSRYEYPSMIPLEIQHRMMDATRSVLQQLGYDNAPFNAEFFYEQASDQVWLLEINPRVSQSHADLFHKVNGVSNFAILVDLALGCKPKPMARHGQWSVAGHMFLRHYEPARVVRTPSEADLANLKKRQPCTQVKIHVTAGQDLRDLPNQDSYSYALAELSIGGRDRVDVLDRYDDALALLPFEFEPAA